MRSTNQDFIECHGCSPPFFLQGLAASFLFLWGCRIFGMPVVGRCWPDSVHQQYDSEIYQFCMLIHQYLPRVPIKP